ncbi:SDR family NAD(P)-dependent oxidoreductase [Arthrobacter bambusae]|uniref:SDR family NAD(P)-dependent oxidoreductase n=1 Tax=Arthrobacter bambusae TaxID=1338426 RepID=UPI0027881D8D|nr:SDR family NAD(P)-dependent oxidoreductase [Arthrobacter bambusae]MDQ0028470.1 NAD(P)-dependent dehydrogenase (short-subunit alcohol dehydrogenase family) [Arthrobacter bambusae]MDQ0096735.1 NAD(P)-dependent dehydrogenase (short-subunit alcohol dehydrogenase family) [Arthrobacter bambusae]
MLLKDKTVIVTGGNSGIGEAIVLAAAAAGANIVIDYVAHPEETSSLIARVKAAGGKAVGLEVDVSSVGGLQALVEKAVEAFGGLDVLGSPAGPGRLNAHRVVSDLHYRQSAR